MTDSQALAILSQRGWDRAGTLERRAGKRWEFRHAGTGEILDIAPGEVSLWAASFLPPVPSGAGDWEWYTGGGFWIVRSKTGRKSGYEHPGYTALHFECRADAERAVALLNARDCQPVQVMMEFV